MSDDLRRSQSKRRTVRADRDHAALLVSVLIGFLALYLLLLVVLGRPTWQVLEQMLPSLGIAMIGVGITVLVTTFSFVFVALSLVSVQFSPRVVRHFWHGDKFRRVFLWSFIGIFGFLFAVQFVGVVQLQLLAVMLSAYGVFVLFPAFLSYLADNINAASITHNIANRTLEEIERDLPRIEEVTAPPPSTVCSETSGFLAAIDTDRLLAVFSNVRRDHPEAVLRVSNYLGSFVEVGSPLAVIEPETPLPAAIKSEIKGCFALHKFRSIDQDIEYGVRQLVDIGVKAISPAVNDPTTCVNCIHYLGVIIKELAGRDLRSRKSATLEGHGIFVKEPSFEQYIDDAFDQIYQFGRRDHVIVRTLLSVLTEILSAAADAGRAAVVAKEVGDMELQGLYEADQASAFPLVEYRDYVRKALRRFYVTAADKFDRLGDQDAAAEHRRRAEAVGASFGT